MIALPFQDRPPRDHLDQAGINAERQLAHYLAREFDSDPRVDLFFGLRLPLQKTSTPSREDAVQLDVLLVHAHGMAIIESKSVHAHVRVNRRGEWRRTYLGKELGMPSPVEQVQRQAQALRTLLRANSESLRERKLLGLVQGGFKACPIECFVAISDKGIIEREQPDLAPEVMKADQIARRVRERIERHRKFGGFLGLLRAAAADDKSDDGMWDMTEQERENIRCFLLNGGKPLPAFAPGQVWIYRTRPGEEASRLVVCRVESHANLGQVVHIHVTGLKIKSPTAGTGFVSEIGHMPYSAQALRLCLTGLESANAAMPDFEQGYRQWKQAFDQGKAGVWTAPLADAVRAMEEGMNRREASNG